MFKRAFGVAAVILCASCMLAAAGARAPAKLAVYKGNGCTGAVRLPQFVEWLGRKPDMIVDFFAMDSWKSMTDDAGWTMGCWKKHGIEEVAFSVPMLVKGKYSLREGADGAYDDTFKALAKQFVDHGYGNSIIRLGWEFNGGWYPWMAEKDPKAFVSYWQRIVTVMRSVPGAKFRFDWCPAQGIVHVKPDTVYPGDEYVDIIGQDFYNQTWVPNLETPQKRWNELLNMPYGLKWHREFARAHNKPESYPEWGTGQRPDKHGGGDDPYFMEQMIQWIADGNVEYHGYWDYPASDFNGRLSDDHQPESGRVFRKAYGRGHQ